MKKRLLIAGLMVLLGLPVHAKTTLKGMTDAQQLGAMAGVALACNAGNRLDDYELIASYMIANQASSQETRKESFKEYAAEKLRTYNMQKENPQVPCPEALQHFYNLPLFASVVYKDGTVKLPDGKVLKAQKSVPQKSTEPKRNYMTPGRGYDS